MNDPMLIWLGFAILGLVALVAGMIPAKPGSWGSRDATAADVARIVGGGKPKPTPRTTAQFVLVLAAVLAMWIVFGGGS